MTSCRHLALTWLLLSAPLAAWGAADFERDVAPVLITRCLECHGESSASGGLVLTSEMTLRRGGDSGAVVDPDQPQHSLLLERVVAGEMPPADDAEPLPAHEIDVLRDWLSAGAPWPEGRTLNLYERTTATRAGRDWWSLQPVVRPEVPATNTSWISTDIDAFIAAKLQARGWTPAPAGDRATMIRRLSFDLIGLPPSADEIDAFVNDPSEDAYEALVDRLLSSPHHGERWGRYWLDLVRYADTCGYERDQEKPSVWKYRDWVVDALNADMPYDEFVIQQLAGDEIAERDEQSVIATGFLRLGTWNDEPNDPNEYKYERLEDMVHATSSAFLALTVKCARCHDHKFDPIPQADYYRMASSFWAGYIEPRDRAWLGGPNAEELGYDVFGWTDRGREVPPLHRLRNGDPAHPEEEIVPADLKLLPDLVEPVSLTRNDATTTQRRLRLAEWITDARNPLTPRVLVNRLWQHHFGEGLVRTPDNFGFHSDQPEYPQLLDWLAAELVEPTVATREQVAGNEFSDAPWTIKRLHKLIVMSAVYRQASNHPQHDAYSAEDPSNRLLWHMPRRRRDADALRDALLTASGTIDLRVGGPSFRPTISAEALEGLSRKDAAWVASPPEEQNRRSLYQFLQRSLLPPLMTTFDQQDTTLPCAQRDVTTVAPQALALLNNEFVHEQSRTLAMKILGDAPADTEAQIRAAWRSVLGRDPTPDETAAAVQHVEQQQNRFTGTAIEADLTPATLALASLCHVLMNTNEFLYVD